MSTNSRPFTLSKKGRGYLEFLYILPFLLLVALMSCYPLYGWIYQELFAHDCEVWQPEVDAKKAAAL